MPPFRRLLQAYREVFFIGAKHSPTPAAAPLKLHDPVLGGLSGTTDELNGVIQAEPIHSNLIIRPDGQLIESALQLAVSVFQQVAVLNEKCKQHVAKELLSVYNEGWRMGEMLQPDGSTVAFESSELSAGEFMSHLRLSDVEITGNELVALWYECGDLFWGHVVSVTSFEGVAFENPHVELQG